jgi:uncharacterized protein YqjF (DUF2071 family)
MAFLTAHWRDLLMINWAVTPERVARWVPRGCEVDCFEGRTFASLVAFQFRDTRVLKVPIPRHIDFEEVNLRLYVKRVMPDGEVRRGVVFVREIVPRRMIAWVARVIYGEPYVYMPMSHKRTVLDDGRMQLRYSWGDHHLDSVACAALQDLVPGSEPHFIAEHYWGYTDRQHGTSEYRVNHPAWRWREIDSLEKQVDMGALYGEAWADLGDTEPSSQFLAEGSPISVDPCGRLK